MNFIEDAILPRSSDSLGKECNTAFKTSQGGSKTTFLPIKLQQSIIQAAMYAAYGKSLFYVDFVIRMKNGHVYLFDTKSAGSDVTAPEKHNALLQYIQEYSTKDTPLYGGVIIQDGSNWLYSKLPIENTTDLLNWDAFYPENA